MNWNIFHKHIATPKSNAISKTEENEFSKLIRKLEGLQEICNKLCKEMKVIEDQANDHAKLENKLLKDLLNSSKDLEELKDLFENWQSQLSALTNVALEQTNQFDKNIMKPLKTYMQFIPFAITSVQKRNQLLNEYTKHFNKVQKYVGRERTGSVIYKLETSKKQMEKAKMEYEAENKKLLKELPQFYDLRMEFIKCCLFPFIKHQAEYAKEAKNIYENCSKYFQKDESLDDSEASFSKIEQNLKDIKALSITIDD